MNILVLKPGRQAVAYACFAGDRPAAVLAGTIEDYFVRQGRSALAGVRNEMRAACQAEGAPAALEAIALRVTFGGDLFTGPAVGQAALGKVRGLVPRAPLHLPRVLALAEDCAELFPGAVVVLEFETAFFAELPAREHLYALDLERSKTPGLRRYGFHGLLHGAACDHVARVRRKAGLGPARILSICLEPLVEVAAVIGRRPVMVTSGVTPLEGIPGETTCGELDPGIILALGRTMKWGPEQINAVLTQQSGLLGLVGRPVTLQEVFTSTAADVALARQVMEYRILQSCGAGVAAMGGVDALVFSGRYAALGSILGPFLESRLAPRGSSGRTAPTSVCFGASLDRIMADMALAEISRREAAARAAAGAPGR
jgi:acetate kinase